MSDSLRDRISQIIWQRWVTDMGMSMPTGMADKLADAVIGALDLRIEDKYKTASGQKQLFGVSGFFAVEVDGD